MSSSDSVYLRRSIEKINISPYWHVCALVVRCMVWSIFATPLLLLFFPFVVLDIFKGNQHDETMLYMLNVNFRLENLRPQNPFQDRA